MVGKPTGLKLEDKQNNRLEVNIKNNQMAEK